MFCWRITKYNPKFRDKNGFYTKEEWTSFSDIGKIFGNEMFSYDAYRKIEDAYIKSILLFMDSLSLDMLQITDLEKYNKPELNIFYDSFMINMFVSIKNNENLNKKNVATSSRLALRENIWCKLHARNMFVHFGYDYYMYIGSNESCLQTISKIQELGLFVETHNSPYLK